MLNEVTGIELDTLAETAQQQRWNQSLPDPEQDRIFAQTMAQREDLFSMPAAVLGPIADGFEKLSYLWHEYGINMWF